MKATRYATSRQKVCQHCSAAKAKCDRKEGRCTRCARRGLPCTYPQIPLPSFSVHGATGNDEAGSSPFPTPGIIPKGAGGNSQGLTMESTRPTSENSPTNGSSSMLIENSISKDPGLNANSRPSLTPEILSFPAGELFCPINVDRISNRWLNSYIPIPGQQIKNYPATVTAFIYRILKSYVAVTIHGRGVPPFVHYSQTVAASIRPPLSACLSLVRICEKPLPGSQDATADVLQREMGNLYEQHRTFDDVTLLAAFQAYLIYSMVLFFRLNQVSNPFLRQAIMNLQDLACSSSRGGLMCIAEQQRSRPRWEPWVAAEAKRRTLFTMYLFDSVLSSQDGAHTFLGTELQGLPSSSNKSLWRAQTRHEWEMAYNIDLADWPGGSFRIDELWPIPADLDEHGVLERRNRVDQWLENVDEFGTMLYAVTSCTHGG